MTTPNNSKPFKEQHEQQRVGSAMDSVVMRDTASTSLSGDDSQPAADDAPETKLSSNSSPCASASGLCTKDIPASEQGDDQTIGDFYQQFKCNLNKSSVKHFRSPALLDNIGSASVQQSTGMFEHPLSESGLMHSLSNLASTYNPRFPFYQNPNSDHDSNSGFSGIPSSKPVANEQLSCSLSINNSINSSSPSTTFNTSQFLAKYLGMTDSKQLIPTTIIGQSAQDNYSMETNVLLDCSKRDADAMEAKPTTKMHRFGLSSSTTTPSETTSPTAVRTKRDDFIHAQASPNGEAVYVDGDRRRTQLIPTIYHNPTLNLVGPRPPF